jgi:DNA repair photolyase
MYKFIDKTRNFLGGRCIHDCSYCYVNAMKIKYPNLKERYSGEVRLLEKELNKSEGKGKTIFVQDMGDLFADNVPKEFIFRILEHLRDYPENTYLFQTKNPKRFFEFDIGDFPKNIILGTTIETNKQNIINKISKAPPVEERRYWISKAEFCKVFITIEPILDFDIEILVNWLKEIGPDFVNIGADSKSNNLIEPSKEKIELLINELKTFTQLNIKGNLKRLLK